MRRANHILEGRLERGGGSFGESNRIIQASQVIEGERALIHAEEMRAIEKKRKRSSLKRR